MLTLAFGEGERRPEASGGREVTTWRDEDGRICARGFVGARRRWMECPGLGVFAFDASSTVVHAWPAAGVTRDELSDRFTRTLQPAILQAMGWQALHASAVAGGDAALALCGVSGSGKSTLGFALGRAGYRQIADDGVAIRAGRDGVFAHALPFAPRLRDTAAGYFGESMPSAIRPGGAPPLPLKVIFVLQQDPGATRAASIDRLRPAAAFGMLVNHAHCFDPGGSPDGRRFVEDYLQIAGSVPVFAVGYHPAFSRLPAVIDAMIGAASDAGAAPARPLASALP
jgi:hypothetical protein